MAAHGAGAAESVSILLANADKLRPRCFRVFSSAEVLQGHQLRNLLASRDGEGTWHLRSTAFSNRSSSNYRSSLKTSRTYSPHSALVAFAAFI